MQAELEADREWERRLVADLQATWQRSPSLSGVPEATLDNREAWQEFYARYNPWIRRAVRARHVRTCDLDDCVQDVWTLLLCRLDRFDCQRLPCRFRLWLLTVIAATLGITREQVWYRLYRARKKLSRLLKMRGLDAAYRAED